MAEIFLSVSIAPERDRAFFCYPRSAQYRHDAKCNRWRNGPVIWRWYEIVGAYGETIRELINEKFGDGIMSAIDFTIDIDKQEDPKGDRVVVTLNGKFWRYSSW
jgi:cyanase